MPVHKLPMPTLSLSERSGMSFLTDDSLFGESGVRIAFTTRGGGSSKGSYAGLNLGAHVGDDPAHVARNREWALDVLSGGKVGELITLNQVHGTNIEVLHSGSEEEIARALDACSQGADGIVIDDAHVAALLCFADCIPVVMVSPSGAFAVVHAGWRGVMANIAEAVLGELLKVSGGSVCAEDVNIYIGPYIRSECFEVSEDVACRFERAFGADVRTSPRHVDLGRALGKTLLCCGADPMRIADSGFCTVCDNELFFSYRAQGGVCGRHAAIVFREGR